MTAQDAAPPVPLRTILRELQAEFEDAAAANLAHRQEHGCREGSGCETGLRLAGRAAEAQWTLNMTRFLNQE